MTQHRVDLHFARRQKALDAWVESCRSEVMRRWPEIDFDAPKWPLRRLTGGRVLDVNFQAAYSGSVDWADPSYSTALRCLVAAKVLDGDVKAFEPRVMAWRLLAETGVALFALRRPDLDDLADSLKRRATEKRAAGVHKGLGLLSGLLDEAARAGVVDPLSWSMSADVKVALTAKATQNTRSFKSAKAATLDRQIEALSEATKAMLSDDPRLNNEDRAVIALTTLLMCAPSRVNEPLCMSIHDRFTLDAYVRRPTTDKTASLHDTHRLLLMKGSKGAQWAPKPILNFMIELSGIAWQVILDSSRRSRMLVQHYEQHPDRLYLPPELEHLRGLPVTRRRLAQITTFGVDDRANNELGIIQRLWPAALAAAKSDGAAAVFVRERPVGQSSAGLPWTSVERMLLQRVRDRLGRLRLVSSHNEYQGKLSDMLALIDADTSVWLPDAWTADRLRWRLKRTPSQELAGGFRPTVFQALGLRMVVDGLEVDCYIEPHDTRRWLTTQALAARERLSDVLINKWANRLSVKQLSAYDFRTDRQKADQASLPQPNELQSMSRGLQKLQALEAKYGLSTEIVTAHVIGLAVTTLDAVFEATENRPVARTSNQVIVLYPTEFGVCLHQHHETPCRSYECVGCNEQVAVKGHLPTNAAWRKRSEIVNRSIATQLESLVHARNRGVADDPAILDEHLLMLVKHGIDPETMAEDLIDRFHEVFALIRDADFRHALEEAYVARGVVRRLDDPAVTSGALIKYHAPRRGPAPQHELAIRERLGGRDALEVRAALFYEQYAEFAPQSVGLQDQTPLSGADEGDEEDCDEQAA